MEVWPGPFLARTEVRATAALVCREQRIQHSDVTDYPQICDSFAVKAKPCRGQPVYRLARGRKASKRGHMTSGKLHFRRCRVAFGHTSKNLTAVVRECMTNGSYIVLERFVAVQFCTERSAKVEIGMKKIGHGREIACVPDPRIKRFDKLRSTHRSSPPACRLHFAGQALSPYPFAECQLGLVRRPSPRHGGDQLLCPVGSQR
jgi:hypothetical protein